MARKLRRKVFSLQSGAEVLTLKWDQLEKAVVDGVLRPSLELVRGLGPRDRKGRRGGKRPPTIQPLLTPADLEGFRRLSLKRLRGQTAPMYRRIRARLERVRVPGLNGA